MRASLLSHSKRQTFAVLAKAPTLTLLLLALCAFTTVAQAGYIPQRAEVFKRDLIREARAGFGLEAPVATMAAQIHQESAWQPLARSRVGAEGLAQFMPATSSWMSELYPRLGAPEPYNPRWSIRAMVHYNRWLYARVRGVDECHRWAALLSGYNGGLGWVIRDRRLASAAGDDPDRWFESVERYNDGRSAANFRENRDYPRRILLRHEQMYVQAGWGRGVCQGGLVAVAH